MHHLCIYALEEFLGVSDEAAGSSDARPAPPGREAFPPIDSFRLVCPARKNYLHKLSHMQLRGAPAKSYDNLIGQFSANDEGKGHY
jgi:hypothetical protein